MKKIAFLVIAASSVIATPALADVTGTITLNGNVASKCSVTSTTPAGATFAQTVNFNELSQSNGTLRTGLASDFTAAAVQATVVCNTGTPTISVDANPLTTTATPATGYANTINYTATVTVARAGTTAATFSNATTASPLPATTVGGALANSPNNVTIATSGYATPALTDILVAGAYTGNIVIVISPT